MIVPLVITWSSRGTCSGREAAPVLANCGAVNSPVIVSPARNTLLLAFVVTVFLSHSASVEINSSAEPRDNVL